MSDITGLLSLFVLSQEIESRLTKLEKSKAQLFPIILQTEVEYILLCILY